MEVIEKTIEYRKGTGEFLLYPLGDIHAGTKHCVETDLKKTIDEIKDSRQAI